MNYFNVQQGTEDWHRLRRGIPTASCFDQIMTPKTMKVSASADALINELIAERLTEFLPERAETYTSRHMEWGQQTEEEARRFYSLETGLDVANGGFCTSDDGRLGCSPDGLVGEDGGLELKCPTAKVHVGYLRDGILPVEYKTQVHGCLIVTGRKWWDFMSYALGLPAFRIRVVPDDYTAKLKEIIYTEFLPRFDAALAQITALKG